MSAFSAVRRSRETHFGWIPDDINGIIARYVSPTICMYIACGGSGNTNGFEAGNSSGCEMLYRGQWRTQLATPQPGHHAAAALVLPVGAHGASALIASLGVGSALASDFRDEGPTSETLASDEREAMLGARQLMILVGGRGGTRKKPAPGKRHVMRLEALTDVCVLPLRDPSVESQHTRPPRWVFLPPLLQSRSYPLCGVLENAAIVAAGGDSDGEFLASAEMLSNGVWRPIASMREARKQGAAASLEQHVYVTGGYYNSHKPDLSTAETYDAILDQWDLLPAMPHRQREHTLTPVGSALYVVGGFFDDAHIASAVSVLDPREDHWNLRPASANAPKCRSHATAAVGDLLVVTGGVREARSDKVSVYDVRADRWWAAEDFESSQPDAFHIPPTLCGPRTTHTIVTVAF